MADNEELQYFVIEAMDSILGVALLRLQMEVNISMDTGAKPQGSLVVMRLSDGQHLFLQPMTRNFREIQMMRDAHEAITAGRMNLGI